MEVCEFWWTGPAFLRENTEPWQTQAESITVEPLEVRSSSHAIATDTTVSPPSCDSFLLDRYSSLDKLLRVTAYCVKFIVKLSAKVSHKHREKFNLLKLQFLNLDLGHESVLKPSEITNVELLCVFLIQRDSFSSEIKYLKHNKPLKDVNLTKLHPFLDKGLLRLGGRLQHSDLDYEEKHPLILPSKSPLNMLLIRLVHLKTLHGGTQLTLSTHRSRFWIIKGKQMVRNVLLKCVVCRLFSAKSQYQLMGSLPKERVTPAYPFERAGVDFAGPFRLRLSKSRGKGTMKGYVAIFICLSTRAVHLEAVEDYSTEAFIAAFKRFTARRGHCSFLLTRGAPGMRVLDLAKTVGGPSL